MLDLLRGSPLADRLNTRAAELAVMVAEHEHDHPIWLTLTDAEKREAVAMHMLVHLDLFGLRRHLSDPAA